jgi:predicted nucleic acid-binding protein
VITLDAATVIAHLHPDDAHHQAATTCLRDSADTEFVIHSLNLAEVLVGGVRAGRVDELLADLDSIGLRVADRPVDEPLRLARLRVATGLKLPDCCALDTAIATDSTLATFDEPLARAAREHYVMVTPRR